MRKLFLSVPLFALIWFLSGCAGEYASNTASAPEPQKPEAAAKESKPAESRKPAAKPDVKAEKKEEVKVAVTIALHPLFSDNCVLQQKIKLPVWGVGTPGESVTVTLNGKTAVAKVGRDGKWSTELPAMNAGGPFELVAKCADQAVTVKNVLIGEVWICSGQSNMQWSVANSNNAKEEIAAANYPKIRLFSVKNDWAAEKQDNPEGQWLECNPQNIPGFSAVGYYFGRDLHKELGVPVGLINNAWGGTAAQVWTSLEAIKSNPELDYVYQKYLAMAKTVTRDPKAIAAEKKKYEEQTKAWNEAIKNRNEDNQGEKKGWHKEDFDDSKWKSASQPSSWDSMGLKIDGAVWFRKVVEIPQELAGKELDLGFGAIDDWDVTYWNGTVVGQTGESQPNFWTHPRNYKVPAKLVKAGKNVIAVRIFDRWYSAGFMGTAAEMKVGLGDKSVSLAGEWKYEIEHAMTKDEQPPVRPAGNFPSLPSCLYNSRINTLIPYGMRGAIWYQGESNAGDIKYRELFKTMISGWRKDWKQGDFPFLFVQLANFKEVNNVPVESAWAELRESQTLALSLPNTAMAVAIDIGDASNIHPKDKQTVGKRLALGAKALAYGKKLVYSGPLYKSMKVEGDKIRIEFDSVGGGLVAKGGELKRFEIAGEDKAFVWAEAKIDGNAVIVSSDKVAKPVAVRYAWSDNPEGCNLYNKEDLPASPFRTDTWPRTNK